MYASNGKLLAQTTNPRIPIASIAYTIIFKAIEIALIDSSNFSIDSQILSLVIRIASNLACLTL